MQECVNRLLGLGVDVVMLRMVFLNVSGTVVAIHVGGNTRKECAHVNQENQTVHHSMSHCHHL